MLIYVLVFSFYLTASRPDIVFSVGLYARCQSKPKESHLKAVKRIFRYLKHTPDLALWYPTGSLTLLDMLMLTIQASWLIEKAPQVWLIFLDPVWYLRQPENNTMLPCPQQKLNMLQLLLVLLNCCE